MRVAEIFHSIQGEGELTGVPSTFVRFSGCNLRCTWCDTKYASWHPEGENVPTDEILDQVLQYPAAHVVLTGGEPMVAKGIHEFAAVLRERGKHITIETAGTVAPGGIACDLASLSPKLAGSTPTELEIGREWVERHERTRLQPQILKQWVEGYSYQLKFVVSETADLQEIQDVVAALETSIPPHKVLLMPEGTDLQTLNARREMLVELCKSHGYRYCDRLHVALFGHTRGT